ncbi:MAG: TraR/DksA family transcriptional regulator [Actinomycetota bacterium]
MARLTKKPAASKARPKAAPARPKSGAGLAPKKAAAKASGRAKTVRAASGPKAKPAKKVPPKPAAKAAPKAPPKAAAAKVKPAPAKPQAKVAPVAAPKPAPAKPAAAKPAPPKPVVAKPEVVKPEPPKKPRKPELTPKEIATIRASLMEQKAIFMREFTDLEDTAFNISQSEISGEVSFDEEYADAGSFTFEREKELSIGNNIRDLLEKVNHALSAIDHGTYGICENCGNPIAKARLLALPYSTLCLNCKQIDERTR